MMRPFVLLLIGLLGVVPSVASAQGHPTWLYTHQVPLELPANDGLVQFALDPSVVARAGTNLSDLRIVDELHRDLPFGLLVTSPELPPEVSTPAVAPREARRATLATIPRSYVESFDLRLPDMPMPREGWTLEVDVAASDFVAELSISSPNDANAPRATQSVFRMPDGSKQTRFAIPSGIGPILRVELRGQDGFLSPSFRFVSGIRATSTDLLSMPIDDATMRRAGERPTIVFDTKGAVARHGALRIVFGGMRALPPVYAMRDDLEGAASSELLRTKHGPIEPNPDHRAAPVMAFATHRGRQVDARAFRLRSVVQIPRSTERVTRIALTPDIVGEAHVGLGDLRLVDADGYQWPYVITYADTRTSVPIRSSRIASPARRSVFRLQRKVGGLETNMLLVDPGIPLVDRDVVVEDVSDANHPRMLARAKLVRTSGGDSGPIEIRLSDAIGTELRVTIDDGDDAPLAPRFATPFRAPMLLTVAPAGRYTLFVGAHEGALESERPIYDLEQTRDLLLAIRPVDVRPSAISPNAESAPPSAFSRDRISDLVLWGVLILAALALTGLTFRLARSA